MADPKTSTPAAAPALTDAAAATEGKKKRAAAGEAKKPRNLGPKGVAKALRGSINRTNKLLAQAKKEKLLCENKLKAMMQDAECAKTPAGISISWKSTSTSRLDTTALKAAEPEIVNKYTVTATSRRFTISTRKSK